MLADGASTDHGEFALGQNMVVGLSCVDGTTIEDAINVPTRRAGRPVELHPYRRLLSSDVRDTKLGPESCTRSFGTSAALTV